MHTSLFRQTPDGRLDRAYLRTCVVYRLLKKGRITSKARAIELLAERRIPTARGTVEIWLAYPLKHLTINA